MKSHWLHKAGAALLILVLVLGGCQKPAGESESLRSAAHRVIKITAEDLKGKRIGVMTGSPQDKTVEAAVENPELYYFENNPDEALALANGKIDSFICVDAIFRYMQPEHPELAESTFIYDTYHAGAIFPKSKQGEKLQNEMNAYLDEITDSGEMKSLQNYWFSEGEKEPVELPKTGENGILLGAVTSSIPPYSYLIDGKRGGYDIAILKGFCERYGYGINLEEANYAGMVTGTAAEKYDICISVIAWTKERAENVLFSQEYLEYNMIAVVRADTATKDASVLSAPLTILNGKKAGVMTGTPQDEIVLSNVDDAELLY